MTDPVRRRANWEAKYDTERVKATLDAKRADMSARYLDAVTKLCSMETEVRTVLNASGVQTINYVPYLNFGRQLYKLTHGREISFESFALSAYVLLEKWAGRGLDRVLLAKIRTDVFNIGEPTLK